MIVYGRNVAKELIAGNIKINKAFVDNKNVDTDIITLLERRKATINYVSKFDLDKLVDGVHQGIVLDIDDFKYDDIDDMIGDNESLILILDHLEDPHNLGAIIRTCEAAGVSGIIIPKDRSALVNSTVMKISAGALVNVKIAQVTNIINAISVLKNKGFWVVGTKMDASCDYDKFDYPTKTALVIGNEGNGISRIVSDNCDFFVKIPMYGKINSLNASVSAGIFIYEVIRNRK